MIIAIHGMMLFAHYYTWSECNTRGKVLCSFIYMEGKFMLIYMD